jgi:hypothetical protein
MRLDDFVFLHEKFQRHVYGVAVVDAGTKDLRGPYDASLGTAFAVSDEGHFLTAYHVIEHEQPGVREGERLLALTGMHGYGIPDERAFRVDLVEVYPNSDIVLLKGGRQRSGHIPTAATLAKPGAWVGTLGYPLPYFDEEKGKQMLDKRIVAAMISAGFRRNGVRFVELDKHLSHGHSGGPIVTLTGKAIALVKSYRKGWHRVREKREHEGKIIEEKHLFELPVQFAEGTMIQNVASRLRRQGVPVEMPSSKLDEPPDP